ncbi:hypothetical protein RhiirC2_780057 [Rhizophagus irregularis]|uniref:Uncharacterized protein n=1 Tax=Rhizophagus irregularis TaxID=588596 RepID=A0A2N1N8K9_9GLOM|nr:hypothetical protein RhiirC2_780057 [Rhizophagus irregularis]
MNEILHIESLQLLLQKYGDYIENFGLTVSNFGNTNEYEESRRQLLKSFIKYCPKIRYFSSDKPNDINIYSLIENIGQNINYLTILVHTYNYHTFYDEYSSIKHIMKKEKVKYLAILLESQLICNDGKELFSLKDEVNEFKLHNIIVQKYRNLLINENDIVYNFNK